MTARTDPTFRLFLALWPDEPARERIEQWRARAGWPVAAAPVPAQHLHLTLHFIGNVPSARVDALRRAARVPFTAFDLRLVKARVWPGRIAVLVPGSTPAALTGLHGALGSALQAAGWPVETRAWQPHVTLARKADAAALPSVPVDIPWRADQGYALVQSVPGAGYAALEHYA